MFVCKVLISFLIVSYAYLVYVQDWLMVLENYVSNSETPKHDDAEPLILAHSVPEYQSAKEVLQRKSQGIELSLIFINSEDLGILQIFEFIFKWN